MRSADDQVFSYRNQQYEQDVTNFIPKSCLCNGCLRWNSNQRVLTGMAIFPDGKYYTDDEIQCNKGNT